MTTWVMVRSEDPPEDWRILEYLARDEEKEIDTDAIHAAFRDVPPDRLDAWLAVMSEDLGLIEEVPGPDPGLSGSGDKAGRRWRICDPPAALLGRRTPGNRRGNTGAIRQFLQGAPPKGWRTGCGPWRTPPSRS